MICYSLAFMWNKLEEIRTGIKRSRTYLSRSDCVFITNLTPFVPVLSYCLLSDELKISCWYVYIPHTIENLAYLQCVFCFNFLIAFPCFLFCPFVHIQVETQFIVSPFHSIVSFFCWLHFGFIYYKFRKSTTNIIHCEKQHAPYGGKIWTS